ncbi:MAG: hypothetical protein ACK4GR_00440 [bacterium]
MEIKNSLNKTQINENQTNSKDSNKLSDEFQKQIDKKIKEENKETKKDEQIKNDKNQKDNIDEKPKLDTKDLTTLKLFVLPYMNKDILSVNLKTYIDDKQSNTPQVKQNPAAITKENYNIETEQSFLNELKNKKKNTKENIDFNPFATFEKLTTSLKELAKEEKVKESKIIKELIEKLDVQKLENSRQVEIRFDREKIGSLTVQILNQEDKITIVFKTNSKFLYDELKNNKSLLSSMLESRKLKTDKIVIDYEEVI